jgi:hypothetical protein
MRCVSSPPLPLAQVSDLLADINKQMERLAVAYKPGSDMNEITHAIHNLARCLEDVVEHLRAAAR